MRPSIQPIEIDPTEIQESDVAILDLLKIKLPEINWDAYTTIWAERYGDDSKPLLIHLAEFAAQHELLTHGDPVPQYLKWFPEG